MGAGRVLVVEDEAMVSLLLEDVITMAGGTLVGIADSVAMGMALINESNFDLVILDVNLHGETSEPLAEILQTRQGPVIVATGSFSGSLSESFRDFHVAQKPFHISEMVAKVKALAF